MKRARGRRWQVVSVRLIRGELPTSSTVEQMSGYACITINLADCEAIPDITFEVEQKLLRQKMP